MADAGRSGRRVKTARAATARRLAGTPLGAPAARVDRGGDVVDDNGRDITGLAAPAWLPFGGGETGLRDTTAPGRVRRAHDGDVASAHAVDAPPTLALAATATAPRWRPRRRPPG